MKKSTSKSDWRPFVLRLRTLNIFVLFLGGLMAAVIVLYKYSRNSQLYQTFFVYSTNITVFGSQLSGVAPFPMIPTLLGVVVNLWWGAIDDNARHLQPYLSMSKRSTPISRGVGLSYQSSYGIWAAWKAAVNRHWVLCFITFGTFLCQICKPKHSLRKHAV